MQTRVDAVNQPKRIPMRPLLTLTTAILIPSTLFAHPGHGSVASETAPALHYLTSGAHIGWAAVVAIAAVAAITVVHSRRADARRAG
ncbi:hypothetical protein CA51_22280 [Rosistilla oblonga]|nr:hypothetical protein CA51_22280 [Rosistilla oblonga]